MCDVHGRHVIVINGAARCVVCGNRLFARKTWNVLGNLIDRYRARRALWFNKPALICGVLFY